jgi:hypothetical protein
VIYIGRVADRSGVIASSRRSFVRVRLIAAALLVAMSLGVAVASAGEIVNTAERLAAAEGAAQATSGPTTKREPVISFVLSLVWPGLGQLYNGPTEQTKGIVMIAVAGATLGMMIAGSSGDCEFDNNFNIDCGNETLAAIGAVGYLANFVWSVVDAPIRAKAINRDRGLALDVRPETVAGRRGVRAAVTYSVAF